MVYERYNMKTLTAKIKEPIQVAVSLEGIDFNQNWLTASAVIESSKRGLLAKLRSELHEKIATLSLDDLDFKIL